MAGISENLKYGILRTRDLVELHLGQRVAVRTTWVEYENLNLSNATKIVQFNAARIRLELTIWDNQAGIGQVAIGPTKAFAEASNLQYQFNGHDTITVVREWDTDLDGVVEELWAIPTSSTVNIIVRETILTPLPLDENP